MPSPPLVSIVTPAYNSASYLEELLHSVRAQDYRNIEHIVIDDGSSDDGATLAILRRYPHVRWWSRENRGQYATLNEGFRAATGEFVTTISADDRYADRHAIGVMAEFLCRHADCDVVHGYTQHIDQNGTPLAVQPYQRYPYWMLKYNLGLILHCSLLVRREKLVRDGLFFDESLRFIGDADWLVRLYLKQYRFCRIGRYIAAYRHHSQQVTMTATADRSADALREAERSRVYHKYGSSATLVRFVYAYDTVQQRRVKVASAWRRGGTAEVLHTTAEWIRRKQGART